ncbi:MAG: bifunctional precorrin-2 dehydrogenase/sirohydrochlorin ferrochelatase [Spirochaetes bacterium]|nr:bifunctional precorrin-2 dehydrogenase/sirohydrochlorin ferrochelatase [Spirochaetota bacterium]
MKLYPVFANLKNRLVVIVGGGEVAYRKLNDLLDSGAKIKIIALEIDKNIEDKQKNNSDSIEILKREYKSGDLQDAYIAFAATGNPDVNKAVYREAEKKRILMNSADDPENCSFFVPSMTRKGSLIIAVSTSGDSPAMAARLRKTFEKSIPENTEDILAALREAKRTLKEMKTLNQPERAAILKKLTEDDDLLKKLVQHNKNGTILSFFNCIL